MAIIDKLLFAFALQMAWVNFNKQMFGSKNDTRMIVNVIQIFTLACLHVVCVQYLRPIKPFIMVSLFYAFSIKKYVVPSKVLLIQVLFSFVITSGVMTLCTIPAYAICVMSGMKDDIFVTLIACTIYIPAYILTKKVCKRCNVGVVGESFRKELFVTMMFLIISSIRIVQTPVAETQQQFQLRLFAIFVFGICCIMVVQWIWREHIAAEQEKRDREEKARLAQAAKERGEECLSVKSDNHKLNRLLADTQKNFERMQKQVDAMHNPAFAQEMSVEIQTCLNSLKEIKCGLQEDVDRVLCLSQSPRTGSPSLDEELKTVAEEMVCHKIAFSCVAQENAACHLLPDVLSAYDLRQIIVNLLNNAINAVDQQKPERRIITFTLGKTRGTVRLRVSDSGGYFSPAVLKNLGRKGNTTNGNGFGLVNILEALARCDASFFVEEFVPPRPLGYTKSITIQFDKASVVKISSPRREVESCTANIKELLARENDLVEEDLRVSSN